MGMHSNINHSVSAGLALFVLIVFLLIPTKEAKAQRPDSTKTLQDLQNQFQGEPAQLHKSSDKVELALYKSQQGVASGSSFELLILLAIEDGWHINAHQPLQHYLIGTAFALTEAEQEEFEIEQYRYPEASLLKFGFSDDTLKVYEGKTPIIVTVRAPNKQQPGTYALSGSLAVQACNNSVCLKPSTIPVSLPVQVIGHGETPKIINQDIFNKYRF